MRVLDLDVRELGIFALPAEVYRARLAVTVFRDKTFADVLVGVGLIEKMHLCSARKRCTGAFISVL